jgi:hypothetical protein
MVSPFCQMTTLGLLMKWECVKLGVENLFPYSHHLPVVSFYSLLSFVSPVINGLHQTLAHLIKVIKSLRGQTMMVG